MRKWEIHDVRVLLSFHGVCGDIGPLPEPVPRVPQAVTPRGGR